METSVFQKAKAKARKVKDTIKMKTSHSPNLDNTNQNDQGYDEEEDEQMVVDSEVHDAVPKYESPVVTSPVAGQKKPDDKLGKPATAAEEEQYGSKYTDAQTKPSSVWPDENTGDRGVDTASPTGMGAAGVQVPENRDGSFPSSGNLGAPGSESAGNFVHGEGGHLGDPKISTETPAAIEEDPYTPNDQSKVADPTGAGIGSILNSFNKLNVDDGEPESKPISERAPETYAESQDHFPQEPILPTSTINPDDPGSIPKSFDGDKPEDEPLDNVTKLPSNQSSYTEEIPYATSGITDKAIAAKNAVASKLGYDSTEDPTAAPKATQGGEEIGKPGTTTEYGQNIDAAESFNKVNDDDGEPESKLISERGPETYTEIQDHFSPESIPPTSTVNPDDPGSIPKSFDGDKPEDAPLDNVTNLPPNQSSYTDKISYATSAVAGTAIAAKNVVASKLGYGSTEDPTASPNATQGGEEIGKPGTTTVYEKVFNAGSSVVTPLYGKVSNVGSSVVSKARGTGTKQDQGVEGQDQEVEGQDQGVPAKGYLAEKLRPSDDDKALSEVISDSLHNRKQEVDGEEEGENQKPAVGIVTESDEVRERLGSDEGNRGITETESKAAPNVSPTGKGLVESVKGTVTSWFSKGGDQKQNSEASPGTIPEEE